MAYQNVGTPRFFIDNYQYLKAIGLNFEEYLEATADGGLAHDFNTNSSTHLITPLEYPEIFGLNPQNATEIPINPPISNNNIRYILPFAPFTHEFLYANGTLELDTLPLIDLSGNMSLYIALLNHDIKDSTYDMGSSGFAYSMENAIGDDFNWGNPNDMGESILNSTLSPDFAGSGSSIRLQNSPIETKSYIVVQYTLPINIADHHMGSVSCGFAYTMPSSAELSLTMEVEFDGYDEVETIGGSTLTNIRYTGAPLWIIGDRYNNPFGVGEITGAWTSRSDYLYGAKRNGRRNWNLKFSYIADSDIFSSNYTGSRHVETLEGYDSGDYNDENEFTYNAFTDDSFMAQVWNKTLGGALPFIFQPDSNNDNPDQFCIAKFDMDTLNIKQVAFKTYNIAVKIREVW